MEERTGLFYSLLGLIIVMLITFLYGVFPTPYKYLSLHYNNGHQFPVRIHRLTGTTEVLMLHRGWIIQEKPKPLDISGLTPVK